MAQIINMPRLSDTMEEGVVAKWLVNIGDDINDYDILNSVKIKGCVFNAVDKIKHICNFISKHKGGNGAVREIAELILNSLNKLEKYKKSGWSEKND